MLRSRAVTLLIALAVGVVFVLGLFAGGALGAALLLVVAALLVVLTRETWPTLTTRGRNVRVLVVGAVLLVAVLKLLS